MRGEGVVVLAIMLECRDAVLVTIAFSLSQGIPEAFYPVFDLDLAPVGVSDRNIGLFQLRSIKLQNIIQLS